MNAKLSIKSIVSLGAALVMLSACGGAKPATMADMPTYPGATELKPGESTLANTLANNVAQNDQLKQAMGGAGTKIDQKGFKLPAAATWAEATKAAAAPDPEPPKPAPPPPPATSAPKPSPTYSASAMPMRPVKPQTVDDNTTYPEQGDAVEHFAFGRCEVVKSDGDRLHIRLGKDGRIKEISTDMLKITELEPEPGSTTKRFKLDRKL